MNNMRRVLAFALLSSIPALASAQSIDFNDGVIGAPIGSHYTTFGVTFENAKWAFFTSPDEADFGASGLKFTNISGTEFQPKSTNPIIANFSSGLKFFSILGLNIGANGASIEVLDIDGNVVGSSLRFGIGTGVDNHETFSFTRSQGDIRSARFYQPLSANPDDGILWDNMVMRADVSTVVPEPGTYALLGTGLLAMALVYRRRRV